MWLRTPLDDILSSRSKVAVLRVICQSPVPLHQREIARRSGLPQGNMTSPVLRELVRSGLVMSRDQGRTKTYELVDPETPLPRELRRLFEAEAARYDDALDMLASGINGLLSLVLFGSEARGEARPGSDTDMLFVVRDKDAELEERLRHNCLRVAEWHAIGVNWQLADLADLREWEETGLDLWRSIQSEGVLLMGRPLEEITRQRKQPGKTT